MLSRILISLIFFFALVTARAKIFAQSSTKDTSNTVRRIDGVDRFLLGYGLDSILKSNGLSMNNVRFVFDSIDMPIFGWNTGTKPSPSIATMFVEHVSGYTKFILKGNLESGVRFVAASGRITFDDTSQKEIHYLFGKSYHYEGISDFKPEESKLRPGESKIKVEDITPIESKSFWDSTAKPILVTLGAVAVIALFFIIRG